MDDVWKYISVVCFLLMRHVGIVLPQNYAISNQTIKP